MAGLRWTAGRLGHVVWRRLQTRTPRQDFLSIAVLWLLVFLIAQPLACLTAWLQLVSYARRQPPFGNISNASCSPCFNWSYIKSPTKSRSEPPGTVRSRPDAARVGWDSNPCMTVPIPSATPGLSVVTVGWLLELSFKNWKSHLKCVIIPWSIKYMWSNAAHSLLTLTWPNCSLIRGYFPVWCGGRCTAPGGVGLRTMSGRLRAASGRLWTAFSRTVHKR